MGWLINLCSDQPGWLTMKEWATVSDVPSALAQASPLSYTSQYSQRGTMMNLSIYHFLQFL